MASSRLLTRPTGALATAFFQVQTPEDLAELLEYDPTRLLYWATQVPSTDRYRVFTIPKSRGGFRTITAPVDKLRLIQQRLNQVLSAVLRPRACMHGFVAHRNVVTNAQPHVGAKVVVNLDLLDFFPSIHLGADPTLHGPPIIGSGAGSRASGSGLSRRTAALGQIMSPFVDWQPKFAVQRRDRRRNSAANRDLHPIHFGRVLGLFLSRAFKRPYDVAKLLAQLCCHDGKLPQGAPTSPVVSNLICHSLDRALTDFARKHGCYYTRYADDITFSSRRRYIPPALAVPIEADGTRVWNCGDTIASLIEKNGFQVNRTKFRVQRDTNHQEVTGLTVRLKPNLRRTYIREIWSDLHVLRKHDRSEHKLRSVRGKIEWVGQVRGKSDPLFLRLLGYWYQITQQVPTIAIKRPRALVENESTLQRMRQEYNNIRIWPDRQEAGLQFESWLGRLFDHSGIALASPFRVTGEQIDGAFEHRNAHYLLEAKWHSRAVGNAQLYPFLGKVTGKSAYTRGLFISVSGYSADALEALSFGKENRLVLMDSRHIERVLDGAYSLATLLDRCIQDLAIRGSSLYEPA